MSEESSGEAVKPAQESLLRASALMASGTLVSRVLGFVRSAMLVAALGVTAGAAASFQLANTLPTMVYNLLAAGVLDAVLVPQIVKALRDRSGSAYVNKLITAVGSILFLLTMAALVATPLLVTLFAPTLEPATRALTITFTIWCVPQIFFYGVYNLFGQLLNAKSVFGPYMWAPVANNVVSIAALGFFLATWGTSGPVFPAQDFTSTQTIVLAGSATLGVITQALILIIPIRRAGVKLRIDFKLKGTSFGSAPKVAMWTFATLMVSQIGVISTTNIATRADTWTDVTGQVVAGIQSYQYAFMMFMLPQSLITVTLVTAIFTRLATSMSNRDLPGVAASYHRGTHLLIALTSVSTGILMVTATPLMQMTMPTFGAEAASLYGTVLVALAPAIPFSAVTMLSQRVFYAMENAWPVFLMGLVPMALQLVVGWGVYFSASPEYWTAGAGAGETVARMTQGFIGLYLVSRAIPLVKARRALRQIGVYGMATAASSLVGWGVLHLLGPGTEGASGLARSLQAGVKTAVTTAVILLVFVTLMRILNPKGFADLWGAVQARLGRKDTGREGEEDQEPEAEALAVAQLPALQEPSVTGALPVLTGVGVEMADESKSGESLAQWLNRVAPEEGTPSRDKPDANAGSTVSKQSSNAVQSPQFDADRISGRPIVSNTGGRARRPRDGKFNATGPALIVGLLVVGGGVWYVSQNLFPEPSEVIVVEEVQSEPQSEPIAESDPGSAAEGEPSALPVIAGTRILSWSDDGGDHPELATLMSDADSSTYWRTRYFDPNTYAQGAPAAIVLNLAEPASVSQIVLEVIGAGGEVTVVVPDGDNPREGQVVGTAALASTTVIPVTDPAPVSSLALVFTELPIDDEGRNRVKIASIAVE